ncbi:MAG: hypothetical protein WCK35_27105, partial [Chloroflexota bacterium]
MTIAQKTHQEKKQSSKPSGKQPGPGTHQAVDRGQLLAAPDTLNGTDMLHAQSAFGNGVVQRVLDGTVQGDGDTFEDMGAGSIAKVLKKTGASGAISYFKEDSRLSEGRNAVLSSTVDQVLGQHVLSKETYKTYKGRKHP